MLKQESTKRATQGPIGDYEDSISYYTKGNRTGTSKREPSRNITGICLPGSLHSQLRQSLYTHCSSQEAGDDLDEVNNSFGKFGKLLTPPKELGQVNMDIPAEGHIDVHT